MLEVFLVFRLSYVMDGATVLPVLVKDFNHRDEAAAYVKEHGGFMLPVLIGPKSGKVGGGEWGSSEIKRATS